MHEETLEVVGGADLEHDLRCDVALLPTSGTVTVAGGQPRAGVQVDASPAGGWPLNDTVSTTTAADGSYAIDLLVGPRYRVVARDGSVEAAVEDIGG